MIYPEIFQTKTTVTEGRVILPFMGAQVDVGVDEEDDTVQLSIDMQWFCRGDLIELASILVRIAQTMPVEDEE